MIHDMVQEEACIPPYASVISDKGVPWLSLLASRWRSLRVDGAPSSLARTERNFIGVSRMWRDGRWKRVDNALCAAFLVNMGCAVTVIAILVTQQRYALSAGDVPMYMLACASGLLSVSFPFLRVIRRLSRGWVDSLSQWATPTRWCDMVQLKVNNDFMLFLKDTREAYRNNLQREVMLLLSEQDNVSLMRLCAMLQERSARDIKRMSMDGDVRELMVRARDAVGQVFKDINMVKIAKSAAEDWSNEEQGRLYPVLQPPLHITSSDIDCGWTDCAISAPMFAAHKGNTGMGTGI